MFERILVPLDGSKLAEQALPYVEKLAKAFNSEVILLGVCEPDENKYKYIYQTYIGSQAEQFKRNVGDDVAVKVETEVLFGNPAQKIINYTQENDINLIIMTCHGRSGSMPWSLGGTITKVLHKLAIPMIIIRTTQIQKVSNEVGIFDRILVPLDGSEKGEAVLPYIIKLTKKAKTETTLLQVLATGEHVHTIGGLDYVFFKDYDMDSRKRIALQYLNKVSKKLTDTKAIVHQEVRIGDPAQEIVKYAKEIACDLISLSSHGHSGIEIWTLGSVTQKILQVCDQHILLVRSLESKT